MTLFCLNKQLPLPIMLKVTTNYQNLLKSILEVSRTRLSGKCIKLFFYTPEEYREFINFLNQNSFHEHYVIKHQKEKPIKIGIKGLLKNMNVDIIDEQLTEMAR
ncbi:hypothetical protein NPIL_483471 [Nephila pilipes]|uniref:Uncharacterized protein n=1 Tax=Nephila pilipes TaxID=299642 RepID=A0A8X6UJL7_NEPPI|nr:hypothetical protein NPIL_483471 [Nephila pilipes]